MNKIIDKIRDLSQEIIEINNLLKGDGFIIMTSNPDESYQTYIKNNNPEFFLIKKNVIKKRDRLVNELKEFNKQI